jgi:hypothetical protein
LIKHELLKLNFYLFFVILRVLKEHADKK